MTIEKPKLENRVSLGNLITIGAGIVAMTAAFWTVKVDVESMRTEYTSQIVELRTRQIQAENTLTTFRNSTDGRLDRIEDGVDRLIALFLERERGRSSQ